MLYKHDLFLIQESGMIQKSWLSSFLGKLQKKTVEIYVCFNQNNRFFVDIWIATYP